MKTQLIEVIVSNYYRGHRNRLTYVYAETATARAATTKTMMRAPYTLDGIVRVMARALATTPRFIALSFRTVSNGLVAIEAYPTRRPQEGRPARAEAWHIHSPLPRRKQVGEFFDSWTALPEPLEGRPRLTFTEMKIQLREAGIAATDRWEFRRPAITDQDRRLRMTTRFMAMALHRQHPASLASLRRALAMVSSAKARERGGTTKSRGIQRGAR